MTLFVTGAQSFIGAELLHLGRQQALDIAGIDLAPARPGCQQADIRDPHLADLIPPGTQTVIHLAAVSRDPDCRANPRLAFDVNVTGTLNLIEAAKARQVPQFIFASSEWVYGSVHNDEAQVEDQPIDATRLQSEYALTKLVGEQCLRLAQTAGLPAATVLRFGIVYGPRPANWSAVEALFNAVRLQEHVQVGNRQTARRFIHVTDIARGLLAARGRTGYEVFNLSGDRLITLAEVVQTSARLLRRQPRLVETNPAQLSIRNPDNAKARALLNWRPEIDLEAGLHSLHLYLENRN